MRRQLKIGLTLTAIVALSALTAFAGTDEYGATPRGLMGRKMVVRPGISSSVLKQSPNNPTKPIPIVESAVGGGRSLSSHDGPGRATPVASSSPQSRLESSLKSLALELR